MLAREEVIEDEESYLLNELSSLGVYCKRRNEFNDKEELEALVIALKEVYFQDYKTAYDGNEMIRILLKNMYYTFTMSDNYDGVQRDDSGQPRTTRSVSIRLDSKVMDELQAEADNRRISFSVFVNQILARYTEWDRYETKVGMMPVPKVILLSLIDKPLSIAKESGIKGIEHYRQQIVRHAAELAFTHIKDSVLFMRKDFDL